MSDIRRIASVAQRVETGPVQFGDDWPGVFIRGDDAFAFCMYLDGPEALRAMAIAQIRRLLGRCDLTGMTTAVTVDAIQPTPGST